jgi:glycosyl transferase family 25
MKTLNDYFEWIVCINLDRRLDRWKKASKIFNNLNLKVERIPAIDGTKEPKKYNLKPGELGCLLSHLNVIKIAKNTNKKNVLILEDDVEFCKNTISLFFEYEKELPNWDWIYLGGNHALNNKYMSPFNAPIQVSDHVYRVREIYSTHSYAIKETIYDDLINIIENTNAPLDVAYSNLHSKLKTYLFRPPLTWQYNDYSDIMEKTIDYSFLKN